MTNRRLTKLALAACVIAAVLLWRASAGAPPPLAVATSTSSSSTSSTLATTMTSTTTTTTTVAPATQHSASKRCKALEPLLADYGLPADPFSYIAWRESRCNPSAVNAKWDADGELVWTLNKNGTYDTGLLQINSIHRRLVRQVCGKDAVKNNLQGLHDLDCQLRVAAVLYDNGDGLSHWRATYKDGK